MDIMRTWQEQRAQLEWEFTSTKRKLLSFSTESAESSSTTELTILPMGTRKNLSDYELDDVEIMEIDYYQCSIVKSSNKTINR
jgi:hypothetical protein